MHCQTLSRLLWTALLARRKRLGSGCCLQLFWDKRFFLLVSQARFARGIWCQSQNWRRRWSHPSLYPTAQSSGKDPCPKLGEQKKKKDLNPGEVPPMLIAVAFRQTLICLLPLPYLLADSSKGRTASTGMTEGGLLQNCLQRSNYVLTREVGDPHSVVIENDASTAHGSVLTQGFGRRMTALPVSFSSEVLSVIPGLIVPKFSVIFALRCGLNCPKLKQNFWVCEGDVPFFFFF